MNFLFFFAVFNLYYYYLYSHFIFYVVQKKYKEEAERTMSYYVPVVDTPEMLRVRENQKNFSTVSHLSLP